MARGMIQDVRRTVALFPFDKRKIKIIAEDVRKIGHVRERYAFFKK